MDGLNEFKNYTSDIRLNDTATNSTSQFDSNIWNVFNEFLGMQFDINQLLLLNIGAMVAFGLDKIFAMNDQWRVRVLNLLLCCLNAPLSSLVSMLLFRHKIRHPQFYILSLIGLYMMYKYGDFILSYYWIMFGYLNFGIIAFSLLIHYCCYNEEHP